MRNLLKKYTICTFLVTLFLVATYSITFVHAQSSIVGDCGQTAADPKCTVKDIGIITKNLLTFLIGLGLPLLVVIVFYRFVKAWFALQQGNANAYKEALNKSWDALLGFFLIVALFGGLMYVLLNYLGIKEGPLKILHMFSDAFILHAYAQSAGGNPFNLTGANNLYDFILSILRLVMRFFIYPALIVIWVWTGFGFVMAQGNPDGLNKAKKWLLWAFATTFLIFLLQTFLIAAQGTVNKILQGTGTQTQTVPPLIQDSTPDKRVSPLVGEEGSVCMIGSTYGQIAGGVCMVGRGAGSPSPSKSQDPVSPGTSCGEAGGRMGTDGNCYRGRGGAVTSGNSRPMPVDYGSCIKSQSKALCAETFPDTAPSSGGGLEVVP